MRIDIFLKKVRLIKTRQGAKEACAKGYVFVNGKRAKASTKIKVGDEILLDLPTKRIRVKVRDLPAGNVSKKEAPNFYEVLESERKMPHREPGFWESIEEESP